MLNSKLFKDLGVGVGLRPSFYNVFLEEIPKTVQWVEVISENFMPWQDGTQLRSLTKLQKVREEVPVALHGVSMSLGSVDPINKNYLQCLKTLIDRINPAQVSDHLCWTGVNNQNMHDLLPLPYTEEAINHVVLKIKQTQDFLGRRILIENVSSYVEFAHNEMPEWEFLKEIAERADCGILLDVNNIYVSAFNHNFDPHDYLKAIPYERVGQIHLAGHTKKGKYIIDTHDEDVCPEVWQLFEWVVQNKGHFTSMIERDGNIPPWHIQETEVKKIKVLREKGVRNENSKSLRTSALL